MRDVSAYFPALLAEYLLVAFAFTSTGAVNPLELESYFYSHDGLDMTRADAHDLAVKEAPILTQCAVQVADLTALKTVLYDVRGMDLSLKEVRDRILPLAKHHVDAKDLQDMFERLYDVSGVDLPKEVARSRAVELVEKHYAEASQLSQLFRLLYDSTGFDMPKQDAQRSAMELGAAGSDPLALERSHKASGARGLEQNAINSAVRANLNGEVRRYAKDGIAYTAAEFQQHYAQPQDQWMKEWLAAPLEKRVARDGKAYPASGFRAYYSSNWEAQWHAATPATQMRIAEDGKTYTTAQFVQYYQSSWQLKWFDAAEVPCKECASEMAVIV